MKRWLPWIVVSIFAAWVLGSLRPPREQAWSFREFGRIPVVYNGRTQPIDSLARNALLQLREKQTANLEPWKGWNEKPRIISASEWIAAVMMQPEIADTWPIFRIDNPDVKGLLGFAREPDAARHQDGKHFSWLEIDGRFADLQREASRANDVPEARRTPYDQALIKLWNAQSIYARMRTTLGPAGTGNLTAALGPYLEKVEAGRAAYIANSKKEQFNEAAYGWFMEQFDTPLVVAGGQAGSPTKWIRVVDSVIQSAGTGTPPHFSLVAFDAISHAYRAGDSAAFNTAVSRYQSELASHAFTPELSKARGEQVFNQVEPFYKAMTLYVCAFLLVLCYWFRPGNWDWVRVAAVGLVALALAVHTGGLACRMFLEGRPPVTNLYSSAIFIGWGATVLGLILEMLWRNSIGSLVSCVIGFLTLIIAHHLALTGDTMEMMRAVLDTNFWLATHVVVVTLGYASTFVAGMLAAIYLVMGAFTRKLTPDIARSLNRMTYGIICFATLFSFVGTVLGGIWADQSWGRFWGWDPKENGALIIVLWNALILHARWGGMVRERGLANLAVVGNIVTSWSWFGVNMLGIGLHSYGFTQGAFKWLMAFIASQLFLLAIGLLPKRLWASSPITAAPLPQSGKSPKLARA